MKETPLSITLKSIKVYIGLVVRTPNMKPGQRHIGILPLVSGYRDPTTLRLVFTEDYKRVYRMKGVDPANFVVTIPLAEIQSANFFDPDIYPKFLREPEASPLAPRKVKSTPTGS